MIPMLILTRGAQGLHNIVKWHHMWLQFSLFWVIPDNYAMLKSETFAVHFFKAA